MSSTEHGARRYGHEHAEAFMLMLYESRDGMHREVLWNSRDGVTPFILSCRCDPPVEMHHVNWAGDRYRPDYEPQPGERIFTDMTPEIAAEHAKPYAERLWDDPTYPASATGMWGSVEEMAAHFADEWMKVPGNPTVVEVPMPPPPEPRATFCLVHQRQHAPWDWEDDCMSERDDAIAKAYQSTNLPEIGFVGRLRARLACLRRGYHDWLDHGDTLGGIWLICADCRAVEEFLPGTHEPRGGEAVWQARLHRANTR